MIFLLKLKYYKAVVLLLMIHCLLLLPLFVRPFVLYLCLNAY